jgi:ribosomal protein L40E
MPNSLTSLNYKNRKKFAAFEPASYRVKKICRRCTADLSANAEIMARCPVIAPFD